MEETMLTEAGRVYEAFLYSGNALLFSQKQKRRISTNNSHDVYFVHNGFHFRANITNKDAFVKDRLMYEKHLTLPWQWHATTVVGRLLDWQGLPPSALEVLFAKSEQDSIVHAQTSVKMFRYSDTTLDVHVYNNIGNQSFFLHFVPGEPDNTYNQE